MTRPRPSLGFFEVRHRHPLRADPQRRVRPDCEHERRAHGMDLHPLDPQTSLPGLIVSVLNAAVGCLPLPVLGMDFDNGSEFINHGVVKWPGNLDIYFTRSHPYRKNDQATIESNNDHLVCRHASYYRYDTSEEHEALGQHHCCRVGAGDHHGLVLQGRDDLAGPGGVPPAPVGLELGVNPCPACALQVGWGRPGGDGPPRRRRAPARAPAPARGWGGSGCTGPGSGPWFG